MRIKGIVIALLIVALALTLGLPAWANGRPGIAIGIAACCLLGLAVTVAGYGPWSSTFHARWSTLQRAVKPYLFAAFCLNAAAMSIHAAWMAVSSKSCLVPEGARNAMVRSLFRGVCEHVGYPAFAVANLVLVPCFIWLGLLLWRAATADRAD